MRQLLSDVRVVDLSDEPAGAYATKVFADLGADVVKVEPPGGGELRRRRPMALLHLDTNKRAVVADVTDDAGRRRLAWLLDHADLVIESPGMGDLAAFGVDRDELRARHPSLVVTSISGFGVDGPYAGYRWSDLVAQTAAWLTYPQGRSDVVPVKMPGIVALCAVGHTAALGGLAGVLRARASGEGAHVDCAASEALGTAPMRVGRFLVWEYRGRSEVTHVPSSASAGYLLPHGLHPCADGYVALMSTPQQVKEMVAVLDDDALREAFARPDAFVRPETKEILDAALYTWLFAHTRVELTTAAQAGGWPFAHVNSPADVLEADHLHQRSFWAEVPHGDGRLLLAGPPYRHAEGGWQLHRTSPSVGEHDAEIDTEIAAASVPTTNAPTAAPRSGVRRAAASAPPLAGIRVLDFTTVWSGPYLTQLLADLGAEVIRIENPSVFPPTTKGYVPRPADVRIVPSPAMAYGPIAEGRPDRPYNRQAVNNSLARNKRSCTLDPRRPEARELFLRLVEHADLVVENLKTKTLHSIGIHESQLLQRNPRLLVLRVPGAGLTGDWADYTGFGGQFDGLSGLAFLAGHHDSAMVETPGTTYSDVATGPAGAFAVLAALHYRAATGRGQVIELAQIENVLAQLGDVFVETQLVGEGKKLGNRDPYQAPQGIYACRGDHQWLAITVADEDQWTALTDVLGAPGLASDARFLDVRGRYEHHDELDAVISAWAATQDATQAFHTLQAAGIAAAPQFDDAALHDDPNVAARGWIRPLATTDVGSHAHIGHAFPGLPQAWTRGSPSLGEDNEYVYRDLIGLDADEYAAIVADGIATNDYLDADGNPV
jgi:crotonobetainyl-CoA:carnitine CoA-transferase CaiB-like acyl-CoA transferase